MSVETARIANYRIIAKIGEGGMASVYLGVMSGLSNFTKLLVIKVLHDDMAERADTLAMFLAEARIAARLNHANVVDTYEVGEDEGRPFIAMEYLQGQPYSAVLRRIGRAEFPLAAQLEVLSEVLEGLHYVHELRDFDGAPLGLVHRDVSPQNVFINYDGRVKLVDFGIAKAACSNENTGAGVIKGKISYLAPEQANGGDVDRRADIFAVGVMLWEAITQRRFTAGQIEAATIQKRIHGAEPRVREIAPDAPTVLARVCDRALEVDPDERFTTALEFQRAIDAFREAEGHRVDRREVGRMIAQSFAAERARVDQLIEDCTSMAVMVRPAEHVNEAALITSSSVVPIPDDDPPAPSRRPRWAWMVSGACLGVGALVLVFFLGRATTSAQEDARSAVSASNPIPLPEPLAAAASIRISVRVQPDSASLWLDGQPLQTNPYEVVATPDNKEHCIRAAADGFESQERVVALDRDIRVEMTLHRAEKGALVDRAEPIAPDVSAPRILVSPAAGDDLRRGKSPKKPSRTIDPTDPYGN